MLNNTDPRALLVGQYSPPDFDLELCAELNDRIIHKNPDINPDMSKNLAVNITWAVGYLCSAFENGFVREIDAHVGYPLVYALRVFMSRDVRTKLNLDDLS